MRWSPPGAGYALEYRIPTTPLKFEEEKITNRLIFPRTKEGGERKNQTIIIGE